MTAFAANRDNAWEIARAVDAITVSTPALVARCLPFNRNVYLLPNALDWEMWENVKPQYEVERERPRIGYMGIARWHREDLMQLAGIISPLLRSRPELEFVAAGDASVHDLLEVPDDQRVSFDAGPFGDHVEITATMDIGLVPLVPGPFNEAKSALKGMEYNACGIPFIASPTVPYADWVAISGGGKLAQRGHDWTRELGRLLDAPTLRRELGRGGRKAAETATIQRQSRQWKSAYETIAAGS
jgi:glycosyltransferase involved in cell wall biosynthesis